MTILRGMMILASVATLTACGFNNFDEVEALREVQPVGSPFTQKLTAEYRDFVNSELDQSDHADALHFSRKGLASARGDLVMPEPLSDWNIQAQYMDELAIGRSRLVTVFDLGAREMKPDVSAVAQARYDCWIEQQEENFQPDDINACKREFLAALEQLEAGMPAPAPAPEPAPAPTPFNVDASKPMEVQNAMYLVFFDFDQSTLGPGAQSVLDSVAQEVSKRSLNAVEVVGHADTSGPKPYNKRLAMRRANAVRDALIKRGIDGNLIKAESRGEEELLVQTPDGVREPANRRAQISFQ